MGKTSKRNVTRERTISRSQAMWLQKVLFALDKAEGDRVKLADLRGDDRDPMAVTIEGMHHDVDAVMGALRDAVLDRLEAIRSNLRNEDPLYG